MGVAADAGQALFNDPAFCKPGGRSPNQDHFSDGLTLDVMAGMVQIPGLILASWVSLGNYDRPLLSVPELGSLFGSAELALFCSITGCRHFPFDPPTVRCIHPQIAAVFLQTQVSVACLLDLWKFF
jgi:hypothetical protein